MAADKRVQFLSRETREVLQFMVNFAKNCIEGTPNQLQYCAKCGWCNRIFAKIMRETASPYMFIAIESYDEDDETSIKFCCLSCRFQAKVIDLIEIYPTLTLLNVKKLMYNNVLKKFLFPFTNSNKKLYKKFNVTDGGGGVERVLQEVVDEKLENEEIEKVALIVDDKIMLEEEIFDLRVDWCKFYNFNSPTKFRNVVLPASSRRVYLEVFYRVYEVYQPFYVYFNRDESVECKYCKKKLYKNKLILFCSRCGFTDPRYWCRLSFGQYDYRKTQWKNRGRVKIMLYDVSN